MITIGIFEAKAHLGELAQSAALGEVVVLTKRGKPLAEIRALQSSVEPENSQSVISALREFRSQLNVGSFDIEQLISEGRR
jgi:antitoxin (DNA-binding transcriptional repressor) of toxin-antitoxin stability system